MKLYIKPTSFVFHLCRPINSCKLRKVARITKSLKLYL